jgi:hypothetical protein
MNRNIISLSVILLTACSPSPAPPVPASGVGASGAGATDSGGTFFVACDNPFGTLGAQAEHICENFYANPGPDVPTLTKITQTDCTEGGGTILSSPCMTVDSVGGCFIGPYSSGPLDGSVFSAGNSYGYSAVQLAYSPGATVASEQENCASQGEVYVPPGGATISVITSDSDGSVAYPEMDGGASESGANE